MAPMNEQGYRAAARGQIRQHDEIEHISVSSFSPGMYFYYSKPLMKAVLAFCARHYFDTEPRECKTQKVQGNHFLIE